MARMYEPKSRREALRSEIIENERLIKGGDHPIEGMETKFASTMLHDGASALEKANYRNKQRLEQITPPKLETLEKERGISVKDLQARASQLESFIKNPVPETGHPGMLSQRAMHETPVGAVDDELAQQNKMTNYNVTPEGDVVRIDPANKGQQSALEEWKDLQLILNQEKEEWGATNITTVDRLRPDTTNANELPNLPRKSYSPLGRISAEEYLRIFGGDKLNPQARQLLEAEAAGKAAEQKTPAEWFNRIYASGKKKTAK